jgi:drug/metabolite transporter (DMT)-like permease
MSWSWAVFVVIAALGQTARNAMQRELTASLGAAGATHVRFLFGFPFALLFLGGVTFVTHDALPHTNTLFWEWDVAGAIAQIFGTAMMLLTMEERSFVVAIAYSKTEPIFVAVFGLVFLGDALSLPLVASILIATAGVMVISYRPGMVAKTKVVLLGLGAGAFFGVSAVGYRGAILALHEPHYLMAATFTLAIGLFIQAALLSAWLALRKPSVLVAIARLWRQSLFAGFMGAAASQFWFLAFALATAASVRTLGLVDVLFAQAASHFIFKQPTTKREAVGITLLVTGAALLVWAQT